MARPSVESSERRIAVVSHVRALRLGRGMSSVRLAGLARVSLQGLRQAERGAILCMQIGTLMRIASALEVEVADCWPILARMPEKRGIGRGSRERLQAREERDQMRNGLWVTK